MNKIIKELLTKGVEKVIVKSELEQKLQSGEKLNIYYGIDPTSKFLHLGHAIILQKLRAFQDMGHNIIVLIGDFTARIGDPTDKQATRTPLTKQQISQNMKTYKRQISKILDIRKIKIQLNSKWLDNLKLNNLIQIASCFTVQQMLERDMFQKRLQHNKPISISEFLYPLMQAYDSVKMDIDLEIGGTDQLFNMLAGRTLQKIYSNKSKSVMALKLLPGLDGRKMSKSFGNTISLEDNPSNMYGKIMSMKDNLMRDYFESLTNLSTQEITNLFKNEPREVKAKLAYEIVKTYHSKTLALKAEKEFNKVFRDKQLPKKLPTYSVKNNKIQITDLLIQTKFANSKSDAKRLIEQNGVKINKTPITNWRAIIQIKNNDILQKGKRYFVKLKV